jgi:hypothetical protein
MVYMIANLLWGRKYLLFISLFIISCKQDPYKMIYGKWQFYKYTPISTICTLTQDEFDIMISSFMGKEIEINRKYVVLDKEHFANPIYEITEEDIFKFLILGYQMDNYPTDFGIEKNRSTVKVLSIYVGEKDLDNRLEFVSPFQYDVGTSFSFSDIILCEDKEELLLFFDSACFHLRKVK